VIVMIAAFTLAFITTPRGADLPLVVIAALMSMAALAAVRNMPLAVIACAAPLARHLELAMTRRRDRNPARDPAPAHADAPAAVPGRSGLSPWPVAAVAIVLALFAGLFSPRLAVDPGDYPVGAVAFMRQHGLRGNILGEFGWGQYLIWQLAPGSKVFVDGRYDSVYPESIVNQYLDFYFGNVRARQTLDAYPHDFVLLPVKAAGRAVTASAPAWRLIYRDRTAVLFARAASGAAQIPGLHIDGQPPPASWFP